MVWTHRYWAYYPIFSMWHHTQLIVVNIDFSASSPSPSLHCQVKNPHALIFNYHLCILFLIWFFFMSFTFKPKHSNIIKSYHGALKHWLSLEIKGLKMRCSDWLVWRLTTTIANFGSKEKGFHQEQCRGTHCDPFTLHNPNHSP